MTNYTSLENSELDWLAGERFGIEKATRWILVDLRLKYMEIAVHFGHKFEAETYLRLQKSMDEDGEWDNVVVREEKYFDNFIPTHPDSNQCERYIGRKMVKEGCTFSEFWDNEGFSVTIEHKNPGRRLYHEYFPYLDPDLINRIKTIARLVAWDKINSRSEAEGG